MKKTDKEEQAGPALTHAGPFLFSLSPSFFVTNVIELNWLL